jgi:hypothetical protein
MRKTVALMVAVLGLVYGVGVAGASDRATKKEAEAMVKKAVALYKKDGDKSFAEFTAPSKSFVKKDLYIVVYDLQGKCVAHGQNPKQVGKELIGMKDPDGKLFIKERVELAQAKGSFWQDYKFTDPITKKVLPKAMFCEKADNKNIICGGIYKE